MVLDYKVSGLAKELFLSYYRRMPLGIEEIERREFGFGNFDMKIAMRHMAFRSADDFRGYLCREVPTSVSMSTAFYRYPDARPMEKKEWLGSELVFDLDASDLNLPCQREHGRSWVCERCFSGVKAEAMKLIEDFLVPDFGISKDDIKVNFSGNRGYHIHVKDRRFYSLKGEERRQISDYITARGINLNAFFPTLGERGTQLRGPRPDSPGWGGRIARGAISTLNGSEEGLERMGVDRETARRLIKNRADVIMGITVGNYDKIRIDRKAEFWGGLFKGMTVTQTSSIDKNVTNGPEHLIRLPNSIHSDTGLRAIKLRSVGDLRAFDPMVDAILFKDGALKVHIEKSQKLVMNGMEFGPYEKAEVELPTYAAIYLLLKRVATMT